MNHRVEELAVKPWEKNKNGDGDEPYSSDYFEKYALLGLLQEELVEVVSGRLQDIGRMHINSE